MASFFIATCLVPQKIKNIRSWDLEKFQRARGSAGSAGSAGADPEVPARVGRLSRFGLIKAAENPEI